jgi:hypothetical protein
MIVLKGGSSVRNDDVDCSAGELMVHKMSVSKGGSSVRNAGIDCSAGECSESELMVHKMCLYPSYSYGRAPQYGPRLGQEHRI